MWIPDRTPLVRRAIANTPAQHWETLCRRRAAKDTACFGSRYPHLRGEDVDTFMRRLVWEEYEVPDSIRHDITFRMGSDIAVFIARCTGGLWGTLPLSELSPEAPLRFMLAELTVLGSHLGVSQFDVELWASGPLAQAIAPRVEHTLIFVRPANGVQRAHVVDFHPGPPVVPKTVARFENDESSGELVDRLLSKASLATARALGFNHVRLA